MMQILISVLVGLPAAQASLNACKWAFRDPSKYEINLDLAKSAGLRYLEASQPGIRRTIVDSRQKDQRAIEFKYFDPQGREIQDPVILARIRALRIPPAYREVWISMDPMTHIQARGIDDRGRTQVRMHPLWQTQVKDARKFAQAAKFGEALPKLHDAIHSELSQKTISESTRIAAVIRLLEIAGIRIGNEKYADENGSFGLTTLQVGHVVSKSPSEIALVFVGKEGVNHDITISDPAVVRVIRNQTKARDAKELLFDVSDSQVNDFIKKYTAENFSAKDFRTWVANVTAIKVLLENRSEKEAIQAVAARLTNEPATAKAHYISPQVFELHRQGKLLELARQVQKSDRPLEEIIAILVLSETSL